MPPYADEFRDVNQKFAAKNGLVANILAQRTGHPGEAGGLRDSNLVSGVTGITQNAYQLCFPAQRPFHRVTKAELSSLLSKNT
jgi:hypothetical protein